MSWQISTPGSLWPKTAEAKQLLPLPGGDEEASCTWEPNTHHTTFKVKPGRARRNSRGELGPPTAYRAEAVSRRWLEDTNDMEKATAGEEATLEEAQRGSQDRNGNGGI